MTRFAYDIPMASGLVSFVALGAGDEALRTERAARRLAEADAVITRPVDSTELVSLAREGKRVVYATAGEALESGQTASLVREVASAGIAIEVVPGVGARAAAAAFAGVVGQAQRVPLADVAGILEGHDEGSPVTLAPRFVLTADALQVARLLKENPAARWLVVEGALPEGFLRDLAAAARPPRRELVVVVSDSTRVFLAERGPEWFARQGIHIRTLNTIDLRALTVNPIAPRSHRFDSAELRSRLRSAVPDVPVFDVLAADYPAAAAGAPTPG